MSCLNMNCECGCLFWIWIVNVDVFSYQNITRCSHLYNNAVSAFSCDERVGARGRLQIFSSLADLQLLCKSTSDRWPYHTTRVLVLGGKHEIARPFIPQNLCQIIFFKENQPFFFFYKHFFTYISLHSTAKLLHMTFQSLIQIFVVSATLNCQVIKIVMNSGSQW